MSTEGSPSPLAGAVGSVLSSIGTGALRDPARFRAALSDVADESDPDTRLLLAHCEEGVLLPFAGAADGPSIEAAKAAARSHLVQADFIDPGTAASACRALADGVAAWAGVGDDLDRGEVPVPGTEAVRPAAPAPRPNPEDGETRADAARVAYPHDASASIHAAGPNITRRRALLLAGGVGFAALAAVAAGTARKSTKSDGVLQTSSGQQAWATLYDDGELSFGDSKDQDQSRTVLHREAANMSKPWWAGQWDSNTLTWAGEWRDQVQRVTSQGSMVASGVLSEIFAGCTALEDISGLATWDVSRATRMYGLFWNCSSLTDVSALSGWDVSSVTNMGMAFAGCSSLTDLSSLSGWDVSAVTNMGYMFGDCSSLTNVSGLSGWDVSAVTEMGAVFSGCSSLADISGLSGWDVSGVTGIDGLSSMFSGCSSLANISPLSGWDVSAVTDMGYMFGWCSSLADVSALSGWDVSPKTSMNYMFDGCPATPPAWYRG